MLHIDRRPQPAWMRSREFLDLRERFEKFQETGGTRKHQERFALDKRLEEFRSDLLGSLHDQFGGRCAYTEVTAVDGSPPLRLVWHRPTNDAASLEGKVDHDHYWWLSLDWDNWYLGSAFVESVKSYQFPVCGDRSGRGDDLDVGVLLDPCRDEPAMWLRFDERGGVDSREPPSDGERQRFEFADRGAVTIRMLGLADQHLVEARREAVKIARKDERWDAPGGGVVAWLLDGDLPHRGALLQLVTRERLDLIDLAPDAEFLSALVEREPLLLASELLDDADDVRPESPANVLTSATRDELADRLRAAYPDVVDWPTFGEHFAPHPAAPKRPAGATGQRRVKQMAGGHRRPNRTAATLPLVSIGPTDRIQRVLVKDFRAIRQIELTIEATPQDDERRTGTAPEPEHPASKPEPAEWKVLLGENGSGKSSILHAIALALAGDRLEEFLAAAGLEWSSILRRTDDPDDRVQGRVLLEFTTGQRIDLRFTDTRAWFHGLHGGSPAMHVNIRAYGATRLLRRGPNPIGDATVDLAQSATALEEAVATVVEESADRGTRLAAINDATARLAEHKATLTGHTRDEAETSIDIGNLLDTSVPVINAQEWLLGLGKDEFNVAALALGDLLGPPSEVPSRAGKRHRRRRRIERREVGGKMRVLVDGDRLEQISDGYRSVIAVACDIMQGIGGLDREGAGHSDLARARGIVIIDEIGAHLHPSWRMQITDRLRRTFPEVQFVITTHEPLCLRGLEQNEVVKVSKWERHGVVVEEIERAPAKYRVDQLLTSEFFGLDSAIDPDLDAKFKRYYELRSAARPSDELDELEHELNGERLRPVLGYTRRDQLMYEAIDDFLALEPHIDDPVERHERRKETVRLVKDQWLKLAKTSR